MEIKTNGMHTDNNSNVLLTGLILLANMDYNSFLDYGIKAMIGGFIWMGFKITADYFSEKIKKSASETFKHPKVSEVFSNEKQHESHE